jgi:hypothetical protein
MNVTAFRHLSVPSRILPALIAVGVNAIFFWGAVRATSVLPPERVSRMSAAAVDSRDRSGRRDPRRGAKTKNAVHRLLRPRRSWVKWFEEAIDQSWIAYDNRNYRERAAQDISFAPAGPARASCLERG